MGIGGSCYKLAMKRTIVIRRNPTVPRTLRRPRRRGLGFTLVELLVVVAVIAILAAIAAPNFMEAQVRAKVARAVSDLRAIAVGLETYAVEMGNYPPDDRVYNNTPIQLTTPIAFLTNARLVDPFGAYEVSSIHGDLARFYTYFHIYKPADAEAYFDLKLPTGEGVDLDFPTCNPGAREKYGQWRMLSYGPDRSYPLPEYTVGGDPSDKYDVLWGSDIPYDATNGTRSYGNVLWTQKRVHEK